MERTVDTTGRALPARRWCMTTSSSTWRSSMWSRQSSQEERCVPCEGDGGNSRIEDTDRKMGRSAAPVGALADRHPGSARDLFWRGAFVVRRDGACIDGQTPAGRTTVWML